MDIKNMRSWVVALGLLGLTFAASADVSNLRNQRYCEILLSYKKAVITSFDVFNTIGLNQCPQALWEKQDVKTLQTETGAVIVKLNGPRYWTIDGIINSSFVNATVKSFNGLAMREAGVLKINLWDIMRGQNPYTTHEVERHTTWVYAAKKPIYELINPSKQVFIMQSYSVQKVPQDATSLAALGSKLQLPEGWSFRTRVLAHEIHLTPVNHTAVVIQDDFLNTYQLETEDFNHKWPACISCLLEKLNGHAT